MTNEEKLKDKLKLCLEALRIYREADMKRETTSILTTKESELVAKALMEAENATK